MDSEEGEEDRISEIRKRKRPQVVDLSEEDEASKSQSIK